MRCLKLRGVKLSGYVKFYVCFPSIFIFDGCTSPSLVPNGIFKYSAHFLYLKRNNLKICATWKQWLIFLWAHDCSKANKYSFSGIKPPVASLVAQMVKNLPTMWETWVRSLGWKGNATHPSNLAWRIPVSRGDWQAAVHGVAKSRTHTWATKQEQEERNHQEEGVILTLQNA